MMVHTYNPKTQEAEEGGFEASLGYKVTSSLSCTARPCTK